MYGPIRKIKVCSDKNNGKPRGYAFIEYEHERDMHSAYKHADGKKIDGRRVLVDVERGRTVKGWRPRRLGGGLGGTRKGGPDENTRFSGRDEYSGRDNAGGGYNRPERADRDESRDRDRGVERRRRTRSPRERGERGAGGAPDRERRRRSRSRDRKRDAVPAGGEDEERERERKKRSRRSSKSRDKDSKKRSRSRDRERKRRRSRSRDRKRKEGDAEGAPGGEPGEFGDVTIKEEPSDEGYPSYAPNGNGNQGNTEEEEGQYDGAPMGD